MKNCRYRRGAGSGTWLAAGILGAVLVALAAAVPPTAAQLLEDPPEMINPQDTLTEAEIDHSEAVALFAHGRVLLQRALTAEGAERKELLAAALRRFQRAWWFDNQWVSIMEDIVPLAFGLDRPLEATRYLFLAAQRQSIPLELLERIAAEWADLDDFDAEQAERALRLYTQIRDLQGESVSTLTQFQIGRLSLTLKRYEEAATAFAAVQQALEADQDERTPAALREQLLKRPETLYALFGESYLRAGRLDEAAAAFQRADAQQANPAVLAFRLALVEHKRGNAQQARDLLQQYFAAHTDAAGLAPYALLTELTDPDSSPDAEQAPPDSESAEPAPRPTRPPSEALLQQLQTLVQEDPDNVLLGYFTADALRRAERWEEATTLYQRLLQQSPAADGHQGLVAIYHRNRQVEPLLKQLSEIVGQTGSLLALDEVADALAEDQDLLDELARTVDAQAQSSPEAPSAPWFALSLLNAQAGRSDLAVEQFLRGLSHTDPPAGQVAVNLAFHLFDQQQPEKAAEVLQQCADKTLLPERMAEVYFYLAGARALAKDTDGALAAARQAAQLAPDDPRMLSREAWVLFQADQWEAARARYLQILDRFDDDFDSPETREALRDIRMALGALDVERQDFAAAEEWLQQVLDEFPEDIGVYNDLGYLWCDRGTRLQRSLKMVQAAVAAEPENTAYLDSLGWALYRLERYDEAIVYLEKAAADDHGDGVILDHLGDAYAGAGRTDEALAAWRRAAEQNTAKGEDSRRQAIEAKIEQYSQK